MTGGLRTSTKKTDRLAIRTETMPVSIGIVDANGWNHLLLTESVKDVLMDTIPP